MYLKKAQSTSQVDYHVKVIWTWYTVALHIKGTHNKNDEHLYYYSEEHSMPIFWQQFGLQEKNPPPPVCFIL